MFRIEQFSHGRLPLIACLIMGAWLLFAPKPALADPCGDAGVQCMMQCGNNMMCGAQCFQQKAQCEANANNGDSSGVAPPAQDYSPAPRPSRSYVSPGYSVSTPEGAKDNKGYLKHNECISLEREGGVEKIVNRCIFDVQVEICSDDPNGEWACPNGGMLNMNPGMSYPYSPGRGPAEFVACKGSSTEVVPTIKSRGVGYCY